MAKKKKEPVQTEMFSNVKDERTPLMLNNITGTQQYKKTVKFIDSKYKLDELNMFAQHFREVFKSYRVVDKDGFIIRQLTALLSDNVRYKADFVNGFAVIAGDPENFKTYFKLLDSKTKQVWDFCFRYCYVSEKEVNQALGGNILVTKNDRYWSYKTFQKLDYVWFFHSGGYYYGLDDDFIALYDEWRELYAKSVFEEEYNEELSHTGIEQLPAAEGLHTYGNENGIGKHLNMTQLLWKQGTIEFGATKMLASVVKKAAQQLGIREFFPDSTKKELQLCAAGLMIPALASYVKMAKAPITNYWENIKKATLQFNYEYMLMVFLEHLKGIKRDYMLNNSSFPMLHSAVLNTLVMLNDNWHDFDSFYMKLIHRHSDKMSLCMMTQGLIYNSNFYLAGGNGSKLPITDVQSCVGTPVIQELLFLFATYGIVEIAYTMPEDDSLTPYSNLKYVKLTSLGKFVLGKQSDYTPVEIKKPTEYFEVDKERLLIRALFIDGENPYEGLLSNIAEPIGNHRYHVTPAAFLKNCENLTDVEAKEDFFHKNVCEKPSEVWDDFFHKMIMRCYPLQSPDNSYYVYKIEKNNGELLKIIATDKYIKEHTLRAEGYHLLIERKALDTVKKHLKNYGFLI